MSSDHDTQGTESRAVSRRAFMAVAAGMAAAWATDAAAGPRKRPHGDSHAKGHRKPAPPAAELDKDKATMQQNVDAVRKYELAATAEPATAFIPGPSNVRR